MHPHVDVHSLEVPYLELAQQAEERKKHFDAWLLYGKASEAGSWSAILTMDIGLVGEWSAQMI